MQENQVKLTARTTHHESRYSKIDFFFRRFRPLRRFLSSLRFVFYPRPIFFIRSFSIFFVLFVSFVVSLSSCAGDLEAVRRAALLGELKSTFAAHPEAAADGFDFPVGRPDGKGYYVALKFGERRHLGEDWNGKRGGNTDRGDPIYAVAAGCVVYADEFGGGWGKVVRIVHLVEKEQSRDQPNVYVESLYAHFMEMKVKKGDLVKRGQVIGTMGDADGQYYAHLHFEMRYDIFLPIGHGYGDTSGFLPPTSYIRLHRPGK
jgi:murein DD-endopeptidase MepM/ murein hydrolase activator NlpD